ncbi:Major facilitator superfamily (MFS) transporter [Oceaniovalibus guishaninsula JLT2003]|uniref:Major facilitator superfamily (MFS) transporter n=1 Tax=Oceaniovalibus guishaninsula JLT2003 TaxID=1231392 RepID=K2GQS9_9RHOB|nr:MFS transporter [Oceaniovalibus guishaninsula]EKE44991.1 Major facilitator superfamily (MFS) transporter [Oceaniovalibus guishaninsula JLT2003]
MTAPATATRRKRIWGWYFFDWASQPYNTLLITFIFGPYVKDLLGDGTRAQAVWGFGIAAAGIVIAVLAPVLGAIADRTGGRMRWIWLFSALYVFGAASLWFAAPGSFSLWLVMAGFALGLIGMEFATIFTNSMLPDLAPREELGRISGDGWAFGYVGGLVALVAMLALFAEDGATGRTLIGIDPVLGLDAAQREGTRAVGPLTALWYAVFMIPFFAWVRDPKPTGRADVVQVRAALAGLGATIRRLPRTPSRFAFLGASMFYRDGLNGTYALGAIFAAGVLDWSVVQTGTFGILAVVTGAIFAWIGGRADRAFGPKPVIVAGVAALIAVVLAAMFVSRDAVFGLTVAEGSRLPDAVFMGIGAAIGAAGGALQAASRTMMVHQADPGRMAEAFGLYALSGKATSFLAPLSIGVATALTGSQQWGIAPLIVLFAGGLLLLLWVKPEGDPA